MANSPIIETGRTELATGGHTREPGVRYNDAPFSTSTTSNWVAKHGGLPPYVRAVARGIRRSGHSLSEAIQMAIGVMSNWIASPHTKPETKAKATAALAWWEKMKLAAHADNRNDEWLLDQLAREMEELELRGDTRSWAVWNAEHRNLHGHALSQHRAAMRQSGNALEIPSKSSFLGAASHHEAAASTFQRLAEQHREAGELPASVSASRVAHAHSAVAVELHAAIHDSALTQHEARAVERARATVQARLKEHEASTRSVQESRDIGEWGPSGPPAASSAGMDPSGAANLLPVGPSKKQSDAITHRFQGTDLTKCSKPGCGRPILDPVHSRHKPGQPIAPIPREANLLLRHAHGEHLHVTSGHLAGHITKARQMNERHMDNVEGPLAAALRSHFADQRRITVNRLLSKNNGKRLMKHAAELLRAAEEDNQPIPPDSPYFIPPDPPAGASPSVNPAMIFMPSYWADKTAQVIAPHLNTATVLAQHAVNSQLGLPGIPGDTSLGALQQIVERRANATAQYVTGVTAKDLSEALQQGVAHGEGMDAIAKRVHDVFDHADMVRARQIAQTAVVGAYNEGATQYANDLPEGTIGARRWISHRDSRTRLTHRLADGQERPLGEPYWVGGAPMMHPGDQSAPISEWINCRCNQVFLPPGLAHSSIADAAAAYVAGLKAVPPKPVMAHA